MKFLKLCVVATLALTMTLLAAPNASAHPGKGHGKGGKAAHAAMRACLSEKGFTKEDRGTEEFRTAKAECRTEIRAARRAAITECLEDKGVTADDKGTKAYRVAKRECRREWRQEQKAQAA